MFLRAGSLISSVDAPRGQMLINVDNNVSDATAYLVLGRRNCRVINLAV